MERVKRYIDIISSLFIINGKIESKIIVVKIKKSPEIIIDVKAIFLNSFLFFKKGSIKNKYNKPPYPKILRLPFKNVFFMFVPKIGLSLVKFKSSNVPKKIIIRLRSMIGIITLFVFTIALNPILFATPIQLRNIINIKYSGVFGK